jgi:hypothetical protein
LRSAANSPSVSSLAFICSNASCNSPIPSGCTSATMSCSEPRWGYTSIVPRSSTAWPSASLNLNLSARAAHIAQESWPSPSLTWK